MKIYIIALLCSLFLICGCKNEESPLIQKETISLPALHKKGQVEQVKGQERAIAKNYPPTSPFVEKKNSSTVKEEPKSPPKPIPPVKKKTLKKTTFPWRLAGIFKNEGNTAVLLMTEKEDIILFQGEEQNGLLLLDVQGDSVLIRQGEDLYHLPLTLPSKKVKKENSKNGK